MSRAPVVGRVPGRRGTVSRALPGLLLALLAVLGGWAGAPSASAAGPPAAGSQLGADRAGIDRAGVNHASVNPAGQVHDSTRPAAPDRHGPDPLAATTPIAAGPQVAAGGATPTGPPARPVSAALAAVRGRAPPLLVDPAPDQ